MRVLVLLLALATPASAQHVRVVHVERDVIVCPFLGSVCPLALREPQFFPLRKQHIDPDHLLPIRATTNAGIVGDCYAVPVDHCRIVGEFWDPTIENASPEAKSPTVNFSVVRNDGVYELRVAPQPCMSSPLLIQQIVVEEVVP